MEELIGYLKSVVYRNSSNDYSVIKIKLDQKKDETVTITGYFKVPNKTQLVKYIGEFVDNKKYGLQFKCDSIELILPSSKESIIRYLSSSLFYGVGPVLATKLVDELGENCLDVISKKPEVLDTFSLRDEIKECILDGIKRNADYNSAISLFVGHGISMKYLMKMDAIYGSSLVEKVTSNPYILIKDIDGLGFKTVDKLALSLGVEENDERRLQALLIYTLKALCYKTLDTYVSKWDLYLACSSQIEDLDVEVFNKLYDVLVGQREIVEEQEKVFYYDLYEAETGIGELLSPYLLNEPINYPMSLIDEEIKRIQDSEGIEYSSEQIDAIHNVLNNNISIITGGPGTGKTTVLNAIIKIYKRLNNQGIVSLVAPTGRASKRMSELSSFQACTIHRLLKWDMETSSFAINRHNPLIGDFLVVDEFSMVDCQLFYHLLDGTREYSKILLIGDDQQLELLCPGNVLKDLIDCGYVNVNRLNTNHRQKENSGIIPLCQDCNKGILNKKNLTKNDVRFFEEKNSDIRDRILDLIKDLIEEGWSQNQIQILAPMYDGPAGIRSLNHLIQDYFNPQDVSKKQVLIGTEIYRVGDRILQLKNQPNDNVFNGDIGYLVGINNEDELTLYIDFDGSTVEYSKNDFQNITHAYAISVHKSQGSEYDVVIAPFTSDHRIMLKRKLIYTALSRAKKKLLLIGSINELEQGIKKIETKVRKTTLKERILVDIVVLKN